MKSLQFVALAFVSYASYNPVKAEGFDDIELGGLFDLYRNERDEKLEEYVGHIKNEVVTHLKEENLMPQGNQIQAGPLAALKEDAALAKLLQNLYNHNVNTVAELTKMSPEDLKNTAANFLNDRQFFPDIPYHQLTAEGLNQVFEVPEQQNYLCDIYLKINVQYQPIYKALDDMPQCSNRVKRTNLAPAKSQVILDQINKFADPNSKKALNVIDMGSSLGFVANYIADNSNHNAQGIDFDAENNYIGNLIAMKQKISAQFKTDIIRKDLIREMLPEYDFMFYLSVLHHVNKEFRFEEDYNGDGTKYVQDLIRMTVDKVPFIIFELAHKQEAVPYPWKTFLPENILDYFNGLPENGYKLHYLDDFGTHLSAVPRPMYLLERKYIEVNSNMYFYNKIFFDAHRGVHKVKYSTIHRYYLTSDDQYFIKEVVEKGDTADLKLVLDTHLKHFSKNSKTQIKGIPKLVDHSLKQDGKHLVTVFEKAKGELVSDQLDLGTEEQFKIVNGAVRILIDLEENNLNHGDFSAWNIMYDKPTSQVSLIDFDHAWEIDQGNQFISEFYGIDQDNQQASLAQSKACILRLLKSMNDKQIYASEEWTYKKHPTSDSENYGEFECIAKDIINVKTSLKEIKSYDFSGKKCTVQNRSGQKTEDL